MAKRPDFVLIDVHNCLHCDDRCRNLLRSGDVEGARQMLADRVVRERGRTILFCDGGPGGKENVIVRSGQRWHYSGRGSADNVIVRFLDQNQTKRHLVITNDRELRGRAKARGALLQTCEQWWQRQLPANGPSEAETDRGPPPPEDVAMWSEIFGVNNPD